MTKNFDNILNLVIPILVIFYQLLFFSNKMLHLMLDILILFKLFQIFFSFKKKNSISKLWDIAILQVLVVRSFLKYFFKGLFLLFLIFLENWSPILSRLSQYIRIDWLLFTLTWKLDLTWVMILEKWRISYGFLIKKVMFRFKFIILILYFWGNFRVPITD